MLRRLFVLAVCGFGVSFPAFCNEDPTKTCPEELTKLGVQTGGQWLRAHRQALGLTQKKIADLLGVHLNNVSSWERGEREISPKKRAKLERYFDGSIKDNDLPQALWRAILKSQGHQADFLVRETPAPENTTILTIKLPSGNSVDDRLRVVLIRNGKTEIARLSWPKTRSSVSISAELENSGSYSLQIVRDSEILAELMIPELF